MICHDKKREIEVRILLISSSKVNFSTESPQASATTPRIKMHTQHMIHNSISIKYIQRRRPSFVDQLGIVWIGQDLKAFGVLISGGYLSYVRLCLAFFYAYIERNLNSADKGLIKLWEIMYKADT